jgi:predicted dehydrogenase
MSAAPRYTLAFVDPGHFHAALTLRERHPRVRDEIFVYAPKGPELDDFLALIQAFNQRAERPTAWRPVIRAGPESLERLERERPGDVVILAGRNDRKMATIRRLHDAGFHVLADKPWLAGPHGLDDLRHVVERGPVAMEIMTGRHEITSMLATRLVGDRELFGEFARTPSETPAIESVSVHHLEKSVNGARLRRPTWFFDIRAQGDGISDIPTHLVDQAQWLVAASGAVTTPGTALELIGARRWATPVPRAVFTRVTGATHFPPELHDLVSNDQLSYLGNAALSFSLGGVTVVLDTRWELCAPAGGGDTSRRVIRGTRAEIHMEQSALTGFRRSLQVVPRVETNRARLALDRLVGEWQHQHPGVSMSPSVPGWRIDVPRELDVGHERQFALVLDEFLSLVDQGHVPPALAADTLAKYSLLARASIAAGRT